MISRHANDDDCYLRRMEITTGRLNFKHYSFSQGCFVPLLLATEHYAWRALGILLFLVAVEVGKEHSMENL